jgi:hypothetical protein
MCVCACVRVLVFVSALNYMSTEPLTTGLCVCVCVSGGRRCACLHSAAWGGKEQFLIGGGREEVCVPCAVCVGHLLDIIMLVVHSFL